MTPAEATCCLHELIECFRRSYALHAADKHAELVSQIVTNCHYPVLLQYSRTNLYRVREGDARRLHDHLHFLSNVRDFKVNPDSSQIAAGRCNHPGVQVLYCSFEERTAQYEAIGSFRSTGYVEVNAEHIAYVGRWQSTRELRLASFIDRPEDRELFATHYPEWASFVAELVSFFREIYVMPTGNNPAVYALTATISEALLERFDGVVFPSSITGGVGTTAALRPSLVDDGSLMFCNACRIRRHAYLHDGSRIDNWLGYASDKEGTLLWMPSVTTMRRSLEEGKVPLAYMSEKGSS